MTNTIALNGRFAVVTGAARGIGYAICERLLQSGAACSLWDLDPDALERAADGLSSLGRVHTAVVDVRQPESVRAATDLAVREFGRIDILVNNAGIAGATRKTWELTPEEWQEVLQIDLFGPYLCCHAIVPVMLEQGYGRIVNIASIAGKEGNPNASHYSAAKAGLNPERLSGHSLRAGFVTEAKKNGADDAAIMDQTGHKCLAMVQRYHRRTKKWEKPASARLGL